LRDDRVTRCLSLLLVALALVASGCGSRVRQEEWDALAAQDGVAARTTATTTDAGQRETTDETGTTLPHQSSSRVTGNHGATATTVAGALPAPADGTYTYDESDDGDKSTTAERWSAQRQADSVTLTSVIKEEDEGDTVTTTTKYRVTRSKFELLSDTSTYNDEDPDTCTYKPPALIMPLPLKVGAKWKTNAVCDGDEASDEDALSFEVTGTSTDTIGGQQVKTFTVRASQSYDTTDETTGERTTYSFTDTRHVDPATLLVVIEDVTFDFGEGKSTVHRQLRSLTPT
jgi:hypothetical protein